MSAPPTGVLFNEARAKPLSTTGLIQPGAYYQFYTTQTLVLTNVYADGGLTTPLSQTPGVGGTTAASDGRLVPIYLNPATTYRYQLYSALGALLEDVDPYIPVSVPTQAQIGTVFYPQTPAELALSVTPTNYFYPATPYVDPRRYGANTAAGDNQVALQTALNVAYQDKSMVWVYGMYKTSPLSVTMTGSATQPLRIVGSSVIGSGFQAVAGLSATSLLTFTNGNPAGFPVEAFLDIENISIVSTAKIVGVHGISIKGLADWTMTGVRISLFDRGLDLLYALTAKCEECEFIQCNTGVKIAVDGSLSIGTSGTPNLLQFVSCRMDLNTTRGLEFNGGTSLQLIGCDIESNGTGGDVTTGGVFILGQTSADALEGHVIFERNWFESNSGWSLNVAAQTNGCVLRVSIRSNEFIGAEAGRNILISGSDAVLVEDQQSATAGDLYNITATKATFINCSVFAGFTLNVTYPVFFNCATSGGPNSTWGIQSQTTLTYTGGSGTNLVNIYQQGAEITLLFADTQGTSSANTFTMTGLPAKYQPGGTYYLPVVLQDNGADSVQHVTMTAGSGTITALKGGSTTGFTATGSKGMRRSIIKYRIDI